MPDQPREAPEKIIVDEDWKARVEREREQFQKQAAPDPEPAEADAKAEKPQASAEGRRPPDDPPLPKPTLLELANTLSIQATLALGLYPTEGESEAAFLPNQARHFIDAIELLYEKTAGNRTANETAALEHMLHELRMAYVALLERKSA